MHSVVAADPQHACAEALRELRARERKLGITPDSDLDGYLKAAAVHGQSSSAVTLLVMRLLGLEARPTHPALCCSSSLMLHAASSDLLSLSMSPLLQSMVRGPAQAQNGSCASMGCRCHCTLLCRGSASHVPQLSSFAAIATAYVRLCFQKPGRSHRSAAGSEPGSLSEMRCGHGRCARTRRWATT